MNADNMVPTINIGDPIIISTAHNKLAGAGIYAFVVDDNLMVRRVAPDLDGGLAVSNDNPKYPSVNLTNFSKRAKILGRVVWKTSRV
jgi:phage repressor protein C with HTH and peptisase S24 domain